MTRKALLALSLILVASLSYAQTDSVKYTRDFVFQDGIYVTIEAFKNNKPNLTPENFKQYNPDIEYLDENFFENKGVVGIARRKVFYPDSLGNTMEKTIDSLFGYSIGNYLFINRHSLAGIGFRAMRVFRLGIISYCFDVSPNSRERTGPLSLLKMKKSSHNTLLPSTEHYFGVGNPKVPQYLFSFKSGDIFEYNYSSFEKLLQNTDSELYLEYSALSDAKKKDMLFVYLNKVNDKHPIYFKN